MTTSAVHRIATTKAIRRLLPLLLIAYFVAFVDRMNVGLAKTQMEADIGLSATAYGLGAGIFFLSYALMEIPSNLILHRVGPRMWIARIAISWGLISSAMMFVNSAMSFYVLRFLLGIAEAGLYPALMYVVTVWFAQEDRARIVGFILVAASLAGVVGNPIGGALMTLDGALGLQGWQWLFLLEGLPAVLIGVIVWFKLPNTPHEATFLTTEEADALVARAEEPAQEQIRGSLGAGFRNPVIVLVALIYFTSQIVTYGKAFFTPAVIESTGVDNSAVIGLIAGALACGSILGVLAFPRMLRRTGSELPLIGLFCLGNIVIASVFLLVPNPTLRLALLFGSAFLTSGVVPMFWSIVMARVTGKMAAGVLAFVNMIGLSGGFFGPYLFGMAEDMTGQVTSGLAVVLGCGAAGLILLYPLTLAVRRSARASAPAMADRSTS